MAFDNGLGDFSAMVYRNRLLNSAFKREDLRQPAKHRLHEMVCREMTGSSTMVIAADNLGVSMHVETRMASAKSLKEGELYVNTYVAYRILSPQGDLVKFGGGSCQQYHIKSERLEAYFTFATRFFFDLIRQVEDPKILERNDAWFRHQIKVINRHKWRG